MKTNKFVVTEEIVHTIAQKAMRLNHTEDTNYDGNYTVWIQPSDSAVCLLVDEFVFPFGQDNDDMVISLLLAWLQINCDYRTEFLGKGDNYSWVCTLSTRPPDTYSLSKNVYGHGETLCEAVVTAILAEIERCEIESNNNNRKRKSKIMKRKITK